LRENGIRYYLNKNERKWQPFSEERAAGIEELYNYFLQDEAKNSADAFDSHDNLIVYFDFKLMRSKVYVHDNWERELMRGSPL